MIAILDYNAGNLTSVRLALTQLGVRAEVTADPARLQSAERIIFPGVGAAGAAMSELKQRGLDEALLQAHAEGKPILAICIGCQIILESSREDGGTTCLGLLAGATDKFRADPGSGVKVPHMGWNQVHPVRGHPLFDGIPEGSHFYFVHSYYPVPADPAAVLAETEYAGTTFVSVMEKANLLATQFHPEKSGPVGLKLIANFLAWKV